MKTHVEFRSDRFPPVDFGREKVDQELFGRRLAEYLKEGLNRKGFRTKEIYEEDWGYIVPLQNDSFRLSVCGSNIPDTVDQFLCFIEPYWPVIYRYWFFGKIDATERIESVQRALDELLTEQERVFDKRWMSAEDFHAKG